MRTMTIGARLTLWYGIVLAASLVALAVIVQMSFTRNLLIEIDRALAEELAEIEVVVRKATNRQEMRAVLQANFGEHPFYEIQVTAADGYVVFQTAGLRGDGFAVPHPQDLGEQQAANVVLGHGDHFRVGTRAIDAPAGRFLMQAADSLQLYNREVRGLTTVLLGTIPLILVMALAGGHWLSRKALAPVDALTDAALEVSASRLDQRVEVGRPQDELGRLGLAFNAMIERLEGAFSEMRRFTADAAHELRTPLAVLRSEAELALRSPRSEEDYRHTLENQLEEISRLTRLTEELLFLSREDAGQNGIKPQPLRVDLLVEQLMVQLQAAAQARDQVLELQSLPEAAVDSDADRLKRLFFNLLDNALKYTPPGGKIHVRGRIDDGAIEIGIRDTGIGIAAEHLPRICGRFYRVDPSRNGEIEGTGLGLAICQAIVDSQHGTLRIDSALAEGTEVTVRLPLSQTGDSTARRSTQAPSGKGPRNVGSVLESSLADSANSAND